MLKNDELTYWLALSFIPGIGRVLYKKLIEHFESPKKIFLSSAEELKRIDGIGEKLARSILDYNWEKKLQKKSL